MKKIILFVCVFAIIGCGIHLNKLRYEERKMDYIQLRQTYLDARFIVYGSNGESEIWKTILKERPELAEMIIKAHEDLVKFDFEITKADKAISEKLMNEQGDKIKITFTFLVEALKIWRGIN